MRDKYNLNTLPGGLPGIDDQDMDEPAVIPGMGPEDKVDTVANQATAQIPGLDFEGVEDRHRPFHKKVPYSKPIPRNFQAQWNETGRLNHEDGRDEDSDEDEAWRTRRQAIIKDPIKEVITQLIETNPPPGVMPLKQLQPQAIIVYGKLLSVEGNPVLAQAITEGPDALQRLINSGEIEELQDVMPFIDDQEYEYNDDDMDLETMSDIELPAPLPSSAFAKKNPGNVSSGSGSGERARKSRFSDLPDPAPAQQPLPDPNSSVRVEMMGSKKLNSIVPGKGVNDKDMRTLQMRAPTYPAPDQDMRFVQGDVDLRQPPRAAMLTGDQDFRRLQTDSDLRQMGGGQLPVDEDLRLGMDQDLRSVPGAVQQLPTAGTPFEADSDFRQSPAVQPLLARPNQGSPGGRSRDVDSRNPHFAVQFGGGQRGPVPLVEADGWSSLRKRRWGDPDQEDDDEPQSGQGNAGHFGRAGSFGSSRSGSGGNFGPAGNNFGSGRGSPGGNFGPGRGVSPSKNFGPDRSNFSMSDGRSGGPDSNFGPRGGNDNNYGSSDDMENMRSNFGPGGRRGGNFGPDGDRGDGYPSEDELDNDDVDSLGRGNGHDWRGSFSHQGQRGPFQGQYQYPIEGGYQKRGGGGRGFPRGRNNFDVHRGGMRGGQRGRYPGGRGRGSRGGLKHSTEHGKF